MFHNNTDNGMQTLELYENCVEKCNSSHVNLSEEINGKKVKIKPERISSNQPAPDRVIQQYLSRGKGIQRNLTVDDVKVLGNFMIHLKEKKCPKKDLYTFYGMPSETKGGLSAVTLKVHMDRFKNFPADSMEDVQAKRCSIHNIIGLCHGFMCGEYDEPCSKTLTRGRPFAVPNVKEMVLNAAGMTGSSGEGDVNSSVKIKVEGEQQPHIKIEGEEPFTSCIGTNMPGSSKENPIVILEAVMKRVKLKDPSQPACNNNGEVKYVSASTYYRTLHRAQAFICDLTGVEIEPAAWNTTLEKTPVSLPQSEPQWIMCDDLPLKQESLGRDFAEELMEEEVLSQNQLYEHTVLTSVTMDVENVDGLASTSRPEDCCAKVPSRRDDWNENEMDDLVDYDDDSTEGMLCDVMSMNVDNSVIAEPSVVVVQPPSPPLLLQPSLLQQQSGSTTNEASDQQAASESTAVSEVNSEPVTKGMLCDVMIMNVDNSVIAEPSVVVVQPPSPLLLLQPSLLQQQSGSTTNEASDSSVAKKRKQVQFELPVSKSSSAELPIVKKRRMVPLSRQPTSMEALNTPDYVAKLLAEVKEDAQAVTDQLSNKLESVTLCLPEALQLPTNRSGGVTIRPQMSAHIFNEKIRMTVHLKRLTSVAAITCEPAAIQQFCQALQHNFDIDVALEKVQSLWVPFMDVYAEWIDCLGEFFDAEAANRSSKWDYTHSKDPTRTMPEKQFVLTDRLDLDKGEEELAQRLHSEQPPALYQVASIGPQVASSKTYFEQRINVKMEFFQSMNIQFQPSKVKLHKDDISLSTEMMLQLLKQQNTYQNVSLGTKLCVVKPVLSTYVNMSEIFPQLRGFFDAMWMGICGANCDSKRILDTIANRVCIEEPLQSSVHLQKFVVKAICDWAESSYKTRLKDKFDRKYPLVKWAHDNMECFREQRELHWNGVEGSSSDKRKYDNSKENNKDAVKCNVALLTGVWRQFHVRPYVLKPTLDAQFDKEVYRLLCQVICELTGCVIGVATNDDGYRDVRVSEVFSPGLQPQKVTPSRDLKANIVLVPPCPDGEQEASSRSPTYGWCTILSRM